LWQGSGQIIDEYCGTCSGRGRVQKSKQLMITIPPGVDSGSRLRIRKEGDAGPKGGPPGDLYVFISVQSSKDFKRDGADIYSQVSALLLLVHRLSQHAELYVLLHWACFMVPQVCCFSGQGQLCRRDFGL
jgi:hypothetical protein